MNQGWAVEKLLVQCLNWRDIKTVKSIHSLILKSGMISLLYMVNNLLNVYVKCNSPNEARQVLDEMPMKNVISFTTVTAGYVQNNAPHAALATFIDMTRAGIHPNLYTFSAMLSASAALESFSLGLQLHCLLCKSQLGIDSFVGSALIHMYAQSKRIEEAWLLFNESSSRCKVLWNSMIVGFVQNSRYCDALKLFSTFVRNGIEPDEITLSSVLKACANTMALSEGKQLHACIIRQNALGLRSVGNSLVDMYAKCKIMQEAWKVFERVGFRDSVTWNALMVGCCHNYLHEEAYRIYCEMRQNVGNLHQNLHLIDEISCSSALSACAGMAALEQGRSVHVDVIKTGFANYTCVSNALIDLYSKSGSMEEALNIFNHMKCKNVISWTALLSGCAQNGFAKQVIVLFNQMRTDGGIQPDYITFVCLLHACSHAGLVKEGRHYFEIMVTEYGIKPKVEHYACLVDLLARAGHLEEAYDLAMSMPFAAAPSVWGALLAACRKHLNTIHFNKDIAIHAAQQLLQLEPQNSGNYLLLSTIYSAAGRLEDAAQVRKLMKATNVSMEPGCSWIEVRNTVHSFVVADRSHPQSDDIYRELQRLIHEIKKQGYVPDTNVLLFNDPEVEVDVDVEEDKREDILVYHSEKLALAFGLISTAPGSAIRIKKNLRVCSDCHTAFKFISKITRRVILLRDNTKYHRFEEGTCSCQDYW